MDRALEDCIYKTTHRGGKAEKIADSSMIYGHGASHDQEEVSHDQEEVSHDQDEEKEVVDDKVMFLRQFFSLSLPGSRHQVLDGAGLTLVLSVHHPNPAVRAAAIRQLSRSLSNKEKASLNTAIHSRF